MGTKQFQLCLHAVNSPISIFLTLDFVIFKGNAAEVVKAIKEHRVEVPWSIHGLVPIWELIFVSLLGLQNNFVIDITVSRRR